MEADDDFPPELVEATASGVVEPEEPSEKTVKVPITIVTGIVQLGLLCSVVVLTPHCRLPWSRKDDFTELHINRPTWQEDCGHYERIR